MNRRSDRVPAVPASTGDGPLFPGISVVVPCFNSEASLEALVSELASVLHGRPEAPPVIASFVGGLGGRDIAPEEFYEMAAVTRRAADEGRSPEPRLLYTATELREFKKLQGIAVAERAGKPVEYREIGP